MMEKTIEDIETEIDIADDKYDLPTIPEDDEIDWDDLEEDEFWDEAVDDYFNADDEDEEGYI